VIIKTLCIVLDTDLIDKGTYDDRRMGYKKLAFTSIAVLALAMYVLPVTDWLSQVTAQKSNEDEEAQDEGDENKLKDGDPDANNGNGNDAKSDDEDDDEDDDDGNPNNREGTPGTERCLERSNGNCGNSPVHDGGYGDTSDNDVDQD
jgi:hypothetical protein